MNDHRATIYLNQWELDILQRLALKYNISEVIGMDVEHEPNSHRQYMTKWDGDTLSKMLYFLDKHEEYKCLKVRMNEAAINKFKWKTN